MALTKVTYSMIQGAPVNVLDYGAVADGSGTSGTDNTTAFQDALDSGAPIVVVPAGSYLIDTLEIPSGVELDITGATLLFKAHTTSHNPMIRMGTASAGVSNAVLRGGTLIGNSAAQTYPAEEYSPGVFIWGSDYCKVIGTVITDCKGDGVTIGYDSGRVVSANANWVQDCEIYENTRQGVAITHGNENSIIDNKISGAIDIEINVGSYEAKNNIVRGNTGRKETESISTLRISDLNISVATLNTNPALTYGNIIEGNSCFNITVQYAHSTIVANNFIVGSNDTQTYILTLNGTRYTTITGNKFDGNVSVATSLLAIVKDFGNSNTTMVGNNCRGDTSTVNFIQFASAYGAETAYQRIFSNNNTDSGYYWSGSSNSDNTEFARFRIDNTNGGSLTATQIAGTKCRIAVSRSAANCVVTSPGNTPYSLISFRPECNATTAASSNLTDSCNASFSTSGSNKTVTMFTHTPAAGAVSLSAFSFASIGGTGTFIMDVYF